MNYNFLEKHLSCKKENNIELGIAIFKPGYFPNDIESFIKLCSDEKLEILEHKDFKLSKEIIIGMYNNVFTYSFNDLIFGLDWKEETIKYLISDNCNCFLLSGKNTIDVLAKFKHEIRKKYGKITHPKIQLTKEEFNDKVIKNLIHVVDEHEIQNILWLLFS